MEDILEKMDPDKRIALINAAMKEFGLNSFEKASTNVIVREAGISKGLLYHYFSNKQAIYDYMVDFWLNRTMKDVLDHVDFENGDLLGRIAGVTEYKIKLFMKYPGIIDFTKGFYANKTFDELKLVAEDLAPNFYQRFYNENVDYSLFREGVDIQKALNITQWTVEKFAEGMISVWQSTGKLDVDGLKAELEQYLDMLKATFYK